MRFIKNMPGSYSSIHLNILQHVTLSCERAILFTRVQRYCCKKTWHVNAVTNNDINTCLKAQFYMFQGAKFYMFQGA